MKPDEMCHLGLSDDQRRIATRVARKVCASVATFGSLLNSAGCPPASTYPPAWLKSPRLANCFAIWGPRGAGKTTLLVEILHRLRSCFEKGQQLDGSSECPNRSNAAGAGQARHSVERRAARYVVVEPEIVDTSLAPVDIPLGLTVVRRLFNALHLRDGEPFSTRSVSSTRERDAIRAFESLEQAYLRAWPGYHQFVRDTAVSPRQHARVAVQEIAERYALPHRLWTWLETEAQQFGVHGFVLALDDLDLTPRGLPRGLLWSLLDELHQPRLLLLLGADVDLLEIEMCPSPARPMERDVETVRGLLFKVVPQDHRASLGPWKLDERLGFPPARDTSDGRRAPGLWPCFEAGREVRVHTSPTIGELLRAPGGPEPHVRLFLSRIPRLLPPYPRGLEVLHNGLLDLRCGPAPTAEGTGSRTTRAQSPASTPEQILVDLAECRGDYALGRRLALRPPAAWAATFRWETTTLAPQAWAALAEGALRPEESLWLLQPTATGLDRPAMGRTALAQASEEGFVDWTEFLLDLALQAGTLAPADLAQRFRPIWERLSAAACRVEFWPNDFDADVGAARSTALAEFAWAAWGEPADRVTGEFGLVPLHAVVTGERSLLPERLLSHLYIGVGAVVASVPDERHGADRFVTRPGLLPRSVRGLIVLADALAGAPWAVLSTQHRRHSVGTFARLAAAFTRAGYVRALRRCAALSLRVPTMGPQTIADAAFLDAFELGAGAEVFGWEDDDIYRRFDALARANVDEALGPPPEPAPPLYAELRVCLDAFLAHPAFADLRRE